MPACDLAAKKRGWCPKHYERWRRHGDPETLLSVQGLSPRERFDAYYEISDSGCWLWTRSLLDGYPQFRADGEFLGHRWAYLHFKGPIPEGRFVCHRCDTPTCVNPDHLFLGTAQTNHDDMAQKGRRKSWDKLTMQDVSLIKERLLDGEGPTSIARDYNVTAGTISHIKVGRSWTRVRPDIAKVLKEQA